MKVESIMELIFSTDKNSYYMFVNGIKIVTDLNTYENLRDIFIVKGVKGEMSVQADGWNIIEYKNK
jgi:hypothetical protein